MRFLLTMHCVINWEPAVDASPVVSCVEQRVKVKVDPTNGVMGTVGIVVQNSAKENVLHC